MYHIPDVVIVRATHPNKTRGHDKIYHKISSLAPSDMISHKVSSILFYYYLEPMDIGFWVTMSNILLSQLFDMNMLP